MSQSVYYNDSEPFVCAWLKNLIAAGLIPAGDVDERPIQEVTPDEVKGYTQAHFFAGIGGWPYALQLAGWGDRPVWTGSCPCPAFSVAGRGRGFSDPRHLWPEWVRLIRQCRPPVVFGEQVEGAIGHGWLDLVSTDMEAEGYAFAAVVLGAHSAGAPHIRQRLWFVADTCGERRDGERLHVQSAQSLQADPQADGSGTATPVAHPPCVGRQSRRTGDATQEQERREPHRSGEQSALPDAKSGGASTGRRQQLTEARTEGRRVAEWATEPNVGRVAHGIPNRVGKLRGFGNTIVPETAAAFVSAYMECVA